VRALDGDGDPQAGELGFCKGKACSPVCLPDAVRRLDDIRAAAAAAGDYGAGGYGGVGGVDGAAGGAGQEGAERERGREATVKGEREGKLAGTGAWSQAEVDRFPKGLLYRLVEISLYFQRKYILKVTLK